MERKSVFTRVLAVVGTVLVWFPILAMILTSVVGSVARGKLMMDYLMPAELFPAILTGGGLLIWAAVRARRRLAPIASSLAIAVVALVGAVVLAEVSGLASGRTEPTGVWFALVIALMVVLSVAVVAAGVAGILLLRDVFGPKEKGEDTPASSG